MGEKPSHPTYPVPFRYTRVRGARKLTLKARTQKILQRLERAYPDPECALTHQSPLQLLAATILSAQCTDERVNQVTRELFKTYRNAEDFAYADPAALEAAIRPTGFFRNKAKSLMGMGRKLVEEFGGKVPRTMEELLTLPGVARKTANVVLGTAYGIAAGVIVDTHVIRLSNRLGFTKQRDPKKIEQDLMALLPKKKWIEISHQLIWHGRLVCQARKPNCAGCMVEDLCFAKDKTV